ncbi:hypothetical protein C8J56DRAFT_1049762 [Mycena floridula]|nr:hypothetical protein C8J56DRAFT_1049762 [Mycena floridula]
MSLAVDDVQCSSSTISCCHRQRRHSRPRFSFIEGGNQDTRSKYQKRPKEKNIFVMKILEFDIGALEVKAPHIASLTNNKET